jgi:hypothetical protein
MVTGYINRKSLLHLRGVLGEPIDDITPDFAAYEFGHFEHGKTRRKITWAELIDRRRKAHAEHLDRKLFSPSSRDGVIPCYVWTFYNPDFIYFGWYCYVITRREHYAVNFRGFRNDLALSIMREIPLPLRAKRGEGGGELSPPSDEDRFDLWMPAFAKAFPRRGRQDKRKAGSRIGWLKDESTFSLARPLEEPFKPIELP